jgi:hypothetical protein
MRTANKHASKVVNKINRRKLANNVQRVLLSLVTAGNDGWVPRTSLRIPSVGARIRDLRKPEFGGFEVECKSANDLNKTSRSVQTRRQTFYRIVPRSVTVTRLTRALKGVI